MQRAQRAPRHVWLRATTRMPLKVHGFNGGICPQNAARRFPAYGGLAVIESPHIWQLRRHMEYRYEATSREGFVQMLASNYLPHGYWFFVQGYVPKGKDPRATDEKLLTKYGIRISRDQRARRKRAGKANLHYLRFGQEFVLLASKGHHSFFDEEASRIRDVRKSPIQFQGYSLSVVRGGFLEKVDDDAPPVADGKLRVRVQIARERFLTMKARFLDIATHRRQEALAHELWNVPFEPYAPIRKQMLNLLRLINQARKEAGFATISPDVLRYRRRIIKPFECNSLVEAA